MTRRTSERRLAGLVVASAAVILIVAAVVAGSRNDGPPPLPLPGTGTVPRQGDPFAYVASREAQFVARATAGSANVLFTKSPGGALATAARVARLRGMINSATAGTGVDPNILEALVFLESAGRPDAIAGSDPAAASGLTQILAQTGQSLLAMHIDLARSRKLTASIDRASFLGQTATVARLERSRARIDDRFDPAKALAGAVRYLEIARSDLGRPDLAVVSYHMGIGNLQQVLSDYGGGSSVPYPQLYFDTAPDHHGSAYRFLSGLGDDSSLYYWRLLGAEQVMRLYRGDRAALARL
ncbi:MAG TPA: transglycosylase SLT domain-containing protein, partial [Solirubrobacteraceae bacterium]